MAIFERIIRIEKFIKETNRKFCCLDNNGEVAGVTSFNGRDGIVMPESGDYDATMVGLGNVDNTSDLDKPISTDTQAALALKADITSFPETVYGGTITWTGTVAPSGATTHRYIGQKVGNLMYLNITLNFATEGTGLTAVTMTLPAGTPSPLIMAGVQASSDVFIYPANGFISRANANTQKAGVLTFMQYNSTATDVELKLTFASSAVKTITYSIAYPTI